MKMGKIHIFLADDHAVLRDGLKLLINAQPDMQVVGEAANGRDTLQQVKELQPDVVIMDISMPDWNGIEATQRLKLELPKIRVVVLTVYEDPAYLRRVVEAEAEGYVLKQSASDELIRAIREVMAGRRYVDPVYCRDAAGDLVHVHKPAGQAQESELSEREAEVLRLIARGHTNREIAEMLFLSVKTVDTYRCRLMDKLNFQSRADIVRYALLRGWLQEP